MSAPTLTALAAPRNTLAATEFSPTRFFSAAITLVLTLGATWGAYLLWRIGFSHTFTGVSIHEVNAHGHAQIFGWVGLFIMGFAYQAFPQVWQTRLAHPGLVPVVFGMMLAGLVTTSVSQTAGLADAALFGGLVEFSAITLFAAQIGCTFRHSLARLEPWTGFVFAGLFFFAAMSAMSTWHTYVTMTAPTRERLLWYVATYQAPLRDLQIHGLALCMILGVSMRHLPGFYKLTPIPRRRAWTALGLLVFSVAAEVLVFIAYRWSGNHVIAAFLMIPWLGLAIAPAMIFLPWKIWRPFPVHDRSEKFIRAAYAWLALSLAMLLFLPVYQHLSHIPFSHAYYGAIRHAITVGFISLMILGMASKVVPMIRRRPAQELPSLAGPFVLLNLGCFLRVTTQTLTDFWPRAFAVVGVSGTLEVIALTWWGLHLIGILRRGRRATV